MGFGTPSYRRYSVRGGRRRAQKNGEKRSLINPIKFQAGADDIDFVAPKETRTWMYNQIQALEDQKKAC